MLDDLQSLALKYAAAQHGLVCHADEAVLHRHIADTLHRCLPPEIVTPALVDQCFCTLQSSSDVNDPMHTGAIHAFAGDYLQNAHDPNKPLLARLHASALRLLPKNRPASREDLRLVTMDALYTPGLLSPGMHSAYLRHRLGLGCSRLSNEEIALRMHQPLVFIHELESAILTTLTSRHTGGSHA